MYLHEMQKIKLLFVLLFLLTKSSVWAQQNFTLWYGVGINWQQTKWGSEEKIRPTSFGVDYSSMINNSPWKWSAGLGFNTKGTFYRVNYLQVEGNMGYCLFNESNLKFSMFTGPFLATKVGSDNFGTSYGIYIENQNFKHENQGYRRITYGWQIGLNIDLKRVSIKVGYERTIPSYATYSNNSLNQVFARAGFLLSSNKKR